MPTTGTTILVIARHGETEANLVGLHQGRTDSPLTSRGEDQAQALGEELRAQYSDAVALYSSPLGRARATAAAIGLPVRIESDLMEGSFGEWESSTHQQLAALRFWEQAKADPSYAAPGGESFAACGQRAADALRKIAARHPEQVVIVVTHQGPICQGIATLTGSGFPGFSHGLQNGGFREVRFTEGGIDLGTSWRERPVDL